MMNDTALITVACAHCHSSVELSKASRDKAGRIFCKYCWDNMPRYDVESNIYKRLYGENIGK